MSASGVDKWCYTLAIFHSYTFTRFLLNLYRDINRCGCNIQRRNVLKIYSLLQAAAGSNYLPIINQILLTKSEIVSNEIRIKYTPSLTKSVEYNVGYITYVLFISIIISNTSQFCKYIHLISLNYFNI